MIDLARETVQSYPRPPALELVPQQITIWLGGTLVAQTTRALRVLETHHAPTYYLPPEDIAATLRPTPGNSFCEWKGVARYYDVLSGDKIAPPARLGPMMDPQQVLQSFAVMSPFMPRRWTRLGSAKCASSRSLAISTAAGLRPIWKVKSRGHRGRSIGRERRAQASVGRVTPTFENGKNLTAETLHFFSFLIQFTHTTTVSR